MTATAIPTSVDIGPHSYTIESLPDTGRLLRDEGATGDSRADRQLVRVDPDRPYTAVAETLLHELTHCCWNQTALRAMPVDENQEEIVTALAPLLLDMLRRNPHLVSYLTSQA